MDLLPHCISACIESGLFQIPNGAHECMAFADIGKEVVVQVDALLRFADIMTLYDIFKNHGIEILSKQRLFRIFFYTG